MIQKRLLTIILIFITLISFGQGVKIEKTTIDSIFIKAKKENKYVFLLLGIYHCGWSLKSNKEFKNDTTIDTFMNNNFINLSFDNKENEKEFIELFAIKDFPRYFFISPDGEIVMMRSTYHKPDKILKYGKKILKGKVVPPNLLMFAGKQYKKNKSTLNMLTHTANAYLRLSKAGFMSTDSTTYHNIKLNSSDFDYIKKEIEKSFTYGSYSTNILIDSLYLRDNTDEKLTEKKN